MVEGVGDRGDVCGEGQVGRRDGERLDLGGKGKKRRKRKHESHSPTIFSTHD